MRPQIDWTNPLSRGLVTAITSFDNTGAVYDAVTRKREYTLQTGGGGVIDPKLNPTPKGLTLSNRPDKQYYWQHSSLHPAGQRKSSILVWFKPAVFASSGTSPFGSGETAASTDHRFAIKQYADSINVSVFTSQYDNAQLNETQNAEQWYLAVGTFDADAQKLILYLDGAEKVNTDLVDTQAISSTGTYFYKIANGQSGDATREFTGDVLLGMVWHDRTLTAAEVAEISRNPWQVFKAQPIIGAHQLPTHVNHVNIREESQGPNGYTVDFRKRIDLGITGPSETFTEHGDLATVSNAVFDATGRSLRLNTDTGVPVIGLNSKRYSYGSMQFSEGLFWIPVASQTANTWLGPAVFIGADSTASDDADNQYAILWAGAGAASNIVRLYRRTENAWSTLLGTTVSIDPAASPVHMRLEAYDRGDQVDLRWWVAGEELTPYSDTHTSRLTSTSVVAGRPFPGVSFGSGGAADAERQVIWFRAGNLPEKTITNRILPINEDLPDLVTWEEELTDMPWNPPS